MLSEILNQKYGIVCLRITPTKGGWMADAYRVDTEQESYFLKVYSKKRAMTAYYTRNIEIYSRVMEELAQKCGFAEYTAIPVAGADGSYRIETENSILWLFPWIDGITVADSLLSDADTVRLAEILEIMHSAVGILGFPSDFPTETFRNFNAVELRRVLTDGAGRAETILRPYAGTAKQALARVNRAEENYRSALCPFVLCHTDIHSWNLMRRNSDGNIMLIDFEGLKLAPAENDLGLLPEEYAERVRFRYSLRQPDPDLMAYYRLTRIIDDIIEEIEEINAAEDAETLAEHCANLQCELEKLRSIKK